MKLSTRSRYGARLMIELAMNYGKGPLSIAEISRKQRIPVKYLEQIIIPLKKAKLVTSVRGPRGGHMLSAPPSRISLWDILILLESKSSLVDCVANKNACIHASNCPVRPVWYQALNAMKKVLKKTSLQTCMDAQRQTRQDFPAVQKHGGSIR
ncbi:MAG: RrF2 family transcriptional regulator [Deltaproteobacteria bacterium]|nr:RrF2 family transcriptional regulator [Deltaproteobacteria bacterium]